MLDPGIIAPDRSRALSRRDGDVLRPTNLAGIEIAVADIPWTR